MNQSTSRHTTLFRVISFIVGSLLLLNTIAISTTHRHDPVSRFLTSFWDTLFGVSSVTSSTTSVTSGQDSTYSNGSDPTQDPPPPPPK